MRKSQISDGDEGKRPRKPNIILYFYWSQIADKKSTNYEGARLYLVSKERVTH